MTVDADFIGWPALLNMLIEGRDLSADLAESAITQILQGDATPSQLTAFMVALKAKGETATELEGMLHAVRAAGNRVSMSVDVAARAIDIVGTGGDKSNSVNISTMSALVVAGAGTPVCKHGNWAASSKTGAADVLKAAGVAVELDAQGVEACIEAAGFGFCLAARFHPAFRYTAPSRREIGIPTAFNLLGPMANPAPISNMLVGVAMPQMMERMAKALASRGVTSAWVVHGHGGLDELAVSGPNMVFELHDGQVRSLEVSAKDFGIPVSNLSDIAGGDPAENLAILHRTLAGAHGPVRDVVTFNAGCAMYVAGLAVDIAEGIERARASIDSGAAADVLRIVAEVSQAEAKRMEI